MTNGMVFNQNFTVGWNAFYQNLMMKVSQSIITANKYESPFTQMLQNMETGDYIEEIHINPAQVLLQDTVVNSDIFTDYKDDLATAIYEVTVDLVSPATYTEYVVRTSFNLIENVSKLINSVVANIRTTLEMKRTNLVKQMLYNGYHYGMISSVKIGDPTMSAENSGRFAVAINTLIDDFRTEINPRNVIYNNQKGITDTAKRQTISTDIPYVIVFNNMVRYSEFNNALNLALINKFDSGDSNQDWQERLIRLNFDDFPTSIPPTNRSEVTGSNVSAKDINFYEMPTDKDGVALFNNTPTGGNTIAGMVIDPSAIKLYTQLSINTSFVNSATLRQTVREIYRGVMQLGAFDKICFITFDKGVASVEGNIVSETSIGDAVSVPEETETPEETTYKAKK